MKKMKMKMKVAVITGSFTVIVALIALFETVYVVEKGNGKTETETETETETYNVEINNSDDVNVNVGNGSIQQNEYNQNSEYNQNNEYYNFYTGKGWSDYNTNELLVLAVEALKNEDYEKAYEIYLTDKMQNNETALCNLGYMYLNGYYVEQNFEKAKEYYSKVKSNNGLKGLLAVAIWEEDKEEILSLMTMLAQKDDKDFWNYISFCQFGKNVEEAGKENIILDENAIPYYYQYEYGDSYYRGINPPESTFLSKWAPVGIDTDENFTPYIIWRNRELLYYGMINKYIGVDI